MLSQHGEPPAYGGWEGIMRAAYDGVAPGGVLVPFAGAGRGVEEVAWAVCEYYQSKPFAYETEWPIRMAVIRHLGVLTHQVLVILHTSIDAYGLSALASDVDGRDPETGAAAGRVVAVPPLEQARR